MNYSGKVFKIQRDFRLRFPLDKPESLLIYISALNPKMLQLAGMKADGVILSHMPIEAADDVKALVEKGASVAGRSSSDIEICVNLPAGINHPEGIRNTRKLWPGTSQLPLMIG